MICSTSLPLRAGVVEAFWNSRNSAADLLVVGLEHDDRVLGHVDSSSWGRQALGAPAVASPGTYPAARSANPRPRGVPWRGVGRQPGAPPGARRPRKEARCPRRPATPWSSGQAPTGSSPPNALADAGWDVVLVEAQDEVGGAVRSAEAWRTRLRHRPVQRLLPAGGGQPGHPRPPPRAARPRLAPCPRRDGPRAPRRPVRRAPPLGERHGIRPGPRATPATATPGCGWWPAGTASATRCSTRCSRPFPPVRAGARLLRRSGVAGTLDLDPARACSRCAAWARRSSAARRLGCCSAATRCTATSPPTARAARCSAGCS